MRNKYIISMFIFAFLLASCRQANQLELSKEQIEVDGVERTYYVHLPPNFDENEPSPLVLAFHGGGGNAVHFDKGTGNTLVEAADERSMVVAFPDGLNNQWCDGRTEHIDEERDCETVGDIAFVSALIDTMVADYGIDPARVYATGISNGGFMSIRLALELSDKIAAVAPVAAQLSVALEDESPQIPISMMLVNGTEDPIVPFDGGQVRLFSGGRSRGDVHATSETIEKFAQFNHCSPTPELVKLPDSDPDDGTTVETESYLGCDQGNEVILVRVIGGGHTWPGGQQYLSEKIVGVASRDANASEMILDFFLRH
ncbi:MAG: PHB depolymerase family esterase [Candidatus Promineifilaceae bacterium]